MTSCQILWNFSWLWFTLWQFAIWPAIPEAQTEQPTVCFPVYISSPVVKLSPRGLDIWTPDNNRLDIISLLMFTGWQSHLECMTTLYRGLSGVYRFSTLPDCRQTKLGTPLYPNTSLCASARRLGFPLNSYVSVIICGIRWDLLTCGGHAYTCRATTGMKITLPVQWRPNPSAWYLKLYLFFVVVVIWRRSSKKDGKSSWGCSDWEAVFVENE